MISEPQRSRSICGSTRNEDTRNQVGLLLRIPLLPPIPTILTSLDLITLEPSIAVTYVKAGHLLGTYGIGVAVTASSIHHDQWMPMSPTYTNASQLRPDIVCLGCSFSNGE